MPETEGSVLLPEFLEVQPAEVLAGQQRFAQEKMAASLIQQP